MSLIFMNCPINYLRNDIAKTLSISIIFVCVVAMILNYFSSYNILYSINNCQIAIEKAPKDYNEREGTNK